MRRLTALIAGAIAAGTLSYFGMTHSSETKQQERQAPVQLESSADKQLEERFDFYKSDFTMKVGRYGPERFVIKHSYQPLGSDQPSKQLYFETIEVYSPLILE